jgi:hypothetical protein
MSQIQNIGGSIEVMFGRRVPRNMFARRDRFTIADVIARRHHPRKRMIQ